MSVLSPALGGSLDGSDEPQADAHRALTSLKEEVRCAIWLEFDRFGQEPGEFFGSQGGCSAERHGNEASSHFSTEPQCRLVELVVYWVSPGMNDPWIIEEVCSGKLVRCQLAQHGAAASKKLE